MNDDVFQLNATEKMTILVYLGKIKKRYTRRHFTILTKRGILNETGHPTTFGNIMLRHYNGDKEYDRRSVPKGRSATKKRRK